MGCPQTTVVARPALLSASQEPGHSSGQAGEGHGGAPWVSVRKLLARAVALGVLAQALKLPRVRDGLPAARTEQAHSIGRRIAARDEHCRAEERTPPRTVHSVDEDFVSGGLLVHYPFDAALEVGLGGRMGVGRRQPQESDTVAGEQVRVVARLLA